MTTHLNPDQSQSPQGQGQDPHRSLHSETGALPVIEEPDPVRTDDVPRRPGDGV